MFLKTIDEQLYVVAGGYIRLHGEGIYTAKLAANMLNKEGNKVNAFQ